MKYEKVTEARFVERPNRFIAKVRIPGQEELETVHVKNTGRCRELLLPDARVVLAAADKADRKTRYDLIGVYKEGLGYINMDSQAPNRMVKEWLQEENPIFPGISFLKPEYRYGTSRVDFYLEERDGAEKVLLEVKGVTLERERIGYFPDAPTERGVKHLKELTAAAERGYRCYIAFVIQMPHVSVVLPNEETHPGFARALEAAEAAGVKILYLGCRMSPEEAVIDWARLKE